MTGRGSKAAAVCCAIIAFLAIGAISHRQVTVIRQVNPAATAPGALPSIASPSATQTADSSQAPSTRVLPQGSPSAPPTSAAKKRTTIPKKVGQTASALLTKKLVPVPADTSTMSIIIRSRMVGDIPSSTPAGVGVVNVPSNTMVQPSDGKGNNWLNTSVRPAASAYPSYPSTGTTYVYGHACWYTALVCPFTKVKHLANGDYTVNPGDQVWVGTPNGTLIYQVTRVGLSPKSNPSLPLWANDSAVKSRIVVVTCDESYHPNGHAVNNIVIAASLVGTIPR